MCNTSDANPAPKHDEELKAAVRNYFAALDYWNGCSPEIEVYRDTDIAECRARLESLVDPPTTE